MTTMITRPELGTITTPDATPTWQPVPHTDLIDGAERALNVQGWRIDSERYDIDKDGARLFATWAIVNGTRHDDYRLSVGIRNAHDKAFAAGIGLGAWVLVCANLDFAADFLIGRKHTSGILRDLPGLLDGIFGRVNRFENAHASRVESYKRTALGDAAVHDIVVRSVDAGVMANSYIGKVLGEWRASDHEEFAPRTAWSLFNAYTEVFKTTNVFDLSGRTTRLHGLLGAVAMEAGNDPRQAALDLPTPSLALAPWTPELGGTSPILN